MIFCFTFFFAISAVIKAQSFNPLLAKKLQDTLDKYVTATQNVKGMAASVYLPGQGIWKGSKGLSYNGKLLDADMLFGIASNTKAFVSVIILKLVRSHKITLEDPLKKWIPNFKNINPNITIRQLLNHSSGISDPIFVSPYVDTLMKYPKREFSPNEVLGWVGPPLFSPGSNWSYSNINYIVAGMIAESATGHHISQLIRDSILIPLKLNSTFYDTKEAERGNLAHRWFNGIDYHDTARIALNTAGGCAGALFSNAGDMALWYHELMEGGVLDSSSMRELRTFIPTGSAYSYGLGLERQSFFGHTVWGHGGSTWGYKSRMAYDSCSGIVVCGLANSFPAGMDGITLLLLKVLVDALPECPGAISGDTEICPGQTNVSYSVAPIKNATSYVWSLPSGATEMSSTNRISVDFDKTQGIGFIRVKGINSYGESRSSSLELHVTVIPKTVSVLGNTLMVDSVADAYQWLNCKSGYLAIAGATLQKYVASASGNYAVEVTKAGCVDTSECFEIIVTHTLQDLNPVLSMYPNPVINQLKFQLREESFIELFTSGGHTLCNGSYKKGNHAVDFPYPNGFYFLRLRRNGSIETYKLVKM